MLCPKCGAEVGDAIRVCDKCLEEEKAAKQETSPVEGVRGDEQIPFVEADNIDAARFGAEGGMLQLNAGFWLRSVALLFDYAVIALISLVMNWLVLGPQVTQLCALFFSLSSQQRYRSDLITQLVTATAPLMLLVLSLEVIIFWLYYTLFESSRIQATPGKILLRLKVTDLQGRRVGFLRSTGRNYGKIISALFLGLGFIMAGVSRNKQALHDALARCLVVRTEPAPLPRILGILLICLLLLFSVRYSASLLFFEADAGEKKEAYKLEVVAGEKVDSDEVNVDQVQSDVLVSVEDGIEDEQNQTIEPAAGSVHFSADDAKATAALWDKKNNILEVGFFLSVLHSLDLDEMRRKASLTAVPEKQPVVVVRFELRSGEEKLGLSLVQQYSVTFFRNEQAKNYFPGEKNTIRFNYLGNADAAQHIPVLRGYLGEGEMVLGHVINTADRGISGLDRQFSWDLAFDAEIIDSSITRVVDQSPEFGSKVPETKAFVLGSQGPHASVKAAGVFQEFSDYVALYYPSEGDVAIGFFTTKLSEIEKAQIVKNRVLWRYVNNKHPNMVIHLDFRRGSKTAAVSSLLAYTVYLYRDKVGSFYFPGPEDRMSFKRIDVEFEEGEVAKADGNMGQGNPFTVAITGKHISETSAHSYSWNINVSTVLRQIEHSQSNVQAQ